MILQHQRPIFAGVGIVAAGGAAADGHVILHQDAVVQHGDGPRRRDLPVRPALRSVKNDVVGLPLSRRTRHVHQGRVLAVQRSGSGLRLFRPNLFPLPSQLFFQVSLFPCALFHPVPGPGGPALHAQACVVQWKILS